MRHLRHQLIDLLDQARKQHRMDTVAPRLMAALVQDFLSLLPNGKSKRVAMHCRTLTHGNLHRHIFTIRCPDQAFYLDAIKGYMDHCNMQPIGQQTMVARMTCDTESCDLQLQKPAIHDSNLTDDGNFMFIALHLSATLSPDPEPIHQDIQAILQAVDLSVSDFHMMRKSVAQAVAQLITQHTDAAALLDWMNDNHYLYFGLQHNHNKPLGLMQNKHVLQRVAPGLLDDINTLPAATEAGLEWINLCSSQHYLYSEASIEVVRMHWFTDSDSNSPQNIETITIIGHFSRSARFANASYLPLLAKHWRYLGNDHLLQHSSFYRREIRTLFDRLPKRILLASKATVWLEPLKAIIDLADPLQLVASIIPSTHGNLDTLLIAISSKRFGPVVMQRILDALDHAGLQQHGYESFSVGPHRIILVAIRRNDQAMQASKLHSLIQHCIVFWKDSAKTEVLRHPDMFDIPNTLKELESIPPLYQELFSPAQFSRDVQMRRRVLANTRTCVHIHPKNKPDHGIAKHEIELHIYSLQQPSLGNLVDIIRSFDLDPTQEAVIPFGSPESNDCIHISVLTCISICHLHNEDSNRLRRGLALVLNHEADHDLLNALIIRSGLDIDAVSHLIALRNHLIQLMPDAAKLPLSDMMLRHPRVSAALHRLFAAHHLLAMPDDFLIEARSSFHEAMLKVASLSDDRWFRALAELVEAGLRTNAFIRQAGSPIGIKIDPTRLSFAAPPKPYREIFVHGSHVEGIHLRAGPIARGGLRYSDRPADFRTEVLELMSTQTVKNGQIVPTGSKGGFVIRDANIGGAVNGNVDAAFVLDQYRQFIRTLLALTDNLIDNKNTPPEGIKIAACDTNDSYLVVAADKGTARFSDDANAEAQAHGFWLDDAFASGGKHGYDHKVVGITARGAWICATHHFAKLGIDACADPISCVAIGDMGGDVFGNGMLLNPALQLIAAFNHQHIFIDPAPNTEQSFKERQRLFNQVAGWGEYDSSIISAGGGIFERSAKSISLSTTVQQALNTNHASLSGEALIQAILSAPVDLLYNGGIGTYVKASDESHAEVRDPANNNVRVDAASLRCKVVCEGGNLGFTQKSRIEFALAGGIINTDAMDNSAGVDMSDHEVNLKILLASLPANALQEDQRNRLLETLTDAVTDQCLADNLLQSRVLTLAECDASEHPPRLQRLRDQLATLNWLDPAVAPKIENNNLLHLRPQLSILLGQEKNRIHAALSEASFYQSSSFSQQLLEDYFPSALQQHYAKDFIHHPLASEIIHTEAANHIVNHIGLVAVHHLETMLDTTVDEIIEALLIAEVILDTKSLQQAIWDDQHDMEITLHLQRELQEQLMLFAEALLRLCPVKKLDHQWINTQQQGLSDFLQLISNSGMHALSSNNHVVLRDIISHSSLNKTHALHMAAMPQLARSAAAVHLASELNIPLQRCLLASQACLQMLPIEEMEEPLRSPDWSSEDAHNLRREWLHRLTHLQSRAITQLLHHTDQDFEHMAITLWQSHTHWPAIEAYRKQYLQGDTSPTLSSGEARRSESKHMRLLLALTQLESIIDCCAMEQRPAS